MKNWQDTLIGENARIREAIAVIDRGAQQICLVVDQGRRLLGTVTDGDVRRGLLGGLTLDDTVVQILHNDPVTARLNDSDEYILQLMAVRHVAQIPILDEQGVVVGIRLRDSSTSSGPMANSVVLMAGGLGSRLRPLTDEMPKSLLKVGASPIIETIIEGFFTQGFQQFFISTNYKGEMIEKAVGDGHRWGIQIEYIREEKPLGTAGALSLLPDLGQSPFFVINGDILTRINYRQLLNFHMESKVSATMCVREFSQQVPYGVVTTANHLIADIVEKPVNRYNVNAGIYLLDSAIPRSLPNNTFLDMPTLLLDLVRNEHPVAAFPVREYWIDIGQINDFYRANAEYCDYFDPGGDSGK